MDYLQEGNLLEESQLTEDAKVQLSSVAQWANIFAIMSFVSLGISLVTTVLAFSNLPGIEGAEALGGGIFTFLIGASISLLLNITLFNAAKYLKAGIAESDQGFFILGITKLASYFKIYGILIIVVGVLVFLILIIALFAGMAGGFR